VCLPEIGTNGDIGNRNIFLFAPSTLIDSKLNFVFVAVSPLVNPTGAYDLLFNNGWNGYKIVAVLSICP